ncbi:MAG: sigma-70 family RNA polymerase sigma factor [Planctomycetota bacterium]
MDPTTTVPIEAMLSQDGFVRGLARRLVLDGGETQDLVQDAWVAALRRPPREERAARAWFATTLRRLARDRVGTDRARRERERQVSRPEAVPSVVDILEREAARREVVEALLNLPETYRDVLLLRFWDDLSPQRIAKRLGRPAATVRSQLHRGLALLRERLDARSGGDRRAWALGLVPLLRLRWGLGLAGAWPLAGAIMTGKYWITAALVAALMLGGGGWALGLFERAAPATVGGGTVAGQPEGPAPAEAAGVDAETGGDHRVAVGPAEAAASGYRPSTRRDDPRPTSRGIGGGFFVTEGSSGTRRGRRPRRPGPQDRRRRPRRARGR